MVISRTLQISLALCLIFLVGCASLVSPRPSADRAALRDGAYRIDPAHAAVIFKIDHLGFSSYVGRFERVDATLDFSSDDPRASRLEAIVEIGSIDVANDSFAETLAGPNWFDAASYPEAVFRSTQIEVTGERTGRITGELTLKGKTAPITLEAVFNGGAQDLLRGGYVLGFSAVGVIDRTVFGIDAFSSVISSEVHLEIEAEFLRR